jgi:DNA-directed RNA polymerase specialized sigma24 family protein
MLVPETEPPKLLQRAEVDSALVGLIQDSGEMARAKKLAKVFSYGLPAMDAEDLLQKAFTLLLAGRRSWPRVLSTLQVLRGVMHSIASNTRKQEDYLLAEDLGAPSNEEYGTEFAPLTEGMCPEADPARTVAAESELLAVRDAVSGDEDLELFVEALAEGLTGTGIATELGWDGKKYDAARKRLSRRLAALKANRS